MSPKERKYFVTGNATFDARIPCVVFIPRSQENWLYLTFFGALAYMTNPASWFTGGETTPEEAAAIFQTVYDEAHAMLFLVGMISDFATPLPDDSGWLQCDGTAYDPELYPDLYETIGLIYNTGGEPSGFFRVPDTRGRARATINSGLTRLPTWADDPGGTGGESEHTLDDTEMPSHTHVDAGHAHAESGATTTLINGGLEAPATSAAAIPAVTGSASADIQAAGGGFAHNNVQPTIVLYTYILAKL